VCAHKAISMLAGWLVVVDAVSYCCIDIDRERLSRAEKTLELRFGGTTEGPQPALCRRSEIFEVRHDLVQEEGDYKRYATTKAIKKCQSESECHATLMNRRALSHAYQDDRLRAVAPRSRERPASSGRQNPGSVGLAA
jgi:hypothetical protein